MYLSNITPVLPNSQFFSCHLHLGESQKTTNLKYRKGMVKHIWNLSLCKPKSPHLLLYSSYHANAVTTITVYTKVLPTAAPILPLSFTSQTLSTDELQALPLCAAWCCFLIPAPWPQPWPVAAFHHCINYSLMIQKQKRAECSLANPNDCSLPNPKVKSWKSSLQQCQNALNLVLKQISHTEFLNEIVHTSMQ